MLVRAQIGKKGFDVFPSDKDVSKHHVTVACLNNYYFLKDAVGHALIRQCVARPYLHPRHAD